MIYKITFIRIAQLIKKNAFHYFFTAWFKYSLESSMLRIYHVHGKFSFSWLALITIIYITFSSAKREKMPCLLVTSYLLTFRSIESVFL